MHIRVVERLIVFKKTHLKAFLSVFFIKEIPDLIELKQKSLDKTLREPLKKPLNR